MLVFRFFFLQQLIGRVFNFVLQAADYIQKNSVSMRVRSYLLSECLFLLQDSHLHLLSIHLLVMVAASLLFYAYLLSVS